MLSSYFTMVDIFFINYNNGENYLQLSELMILSICKRLQLEGEENNELKQI